MIKKIDVDSTAIQSIAHCIQCDELCIDMQNGKTYIYYNIPVDLIEEFIEAYSFGSFYNKNIKGKYLQKEIVDIHEFINFHNDCKQSNNEIQPGKYIAHNIDKDEYKVIDNKENIVDYISQHSKTKIIIYEIGKVILDLS